MKMKYTLLTGAMMALGMAGTASAGAPATPTVACNDDPNSVEVCLNGDLVEVEIKCQGGTFDTEDGIWVDEYSTFLGDFNVAVDVGSTWLCSATGWHDLKKTEGKCTDQLKGPTKGNKNHSPWTGYAVEYEIKTLVEDATACQPSD